MSGVYYPVTVLPGWLQALSHFSPINYTLHGMRAALLDGATLSELWCDIAPLILTALVLVALGIRVFGWAESYCKRTGKLKRSG